MSFYKKMAEQRKNIEEKNYGMQKEALIDIVAQLVMIAFKHDDKLPKEFNIKTINYGEYNLKKFLERIGIKVESVKWQSWENLRPEWSSESQQYVREEIYAVTIRLI